jgi:hypothetical protein
MNKRHLGLACFMLIAAGGLGAGARADITLTFDDPISYGPGGWSVDRHAPNSFGTTPFQGDNRLMQVIDGMDTQANPFANTQGRMFDLQAGTTSMDIQLYVSSDWAAATGDQRFAGFWGVGVDSTNAISSYPIIEFAKIGGQAGFRVWDSTDPSGSWSTISLPGGFAYDQFHTLGIALSGSNIVYSLDGAQIGQVDALGTVSLASVILQGYNGLPVGTNYNIYWDNFHSYNGTAAVPEPASVVSAVLGAAGAGLFALRRGRKAA